jgi:hypothetical protein
MGLNGLNQGVVITIVTLLSLFVLGTCVRICFVNLQILKDLRVWRAEMMKPKRAKIAPDDKNRKKKHKPRVDIKQEVFHTQQRELHQKKRREKKAYAKMAPVHVRSIEKKG